VSQDFLSTSIGALDVYVTLEGRFVSVLFAFFALKLIVDIMELVLKLTKR